MSKHVIVTGASSGIGAATAHSLGRVGWDVTLVARRTDRIETLRMQHAGTGHRVHAVSANLSDAAAANQAMLDAEQAMGPAHALVLCHGTNVPRRRLDELTVEHWDQIVTANLSSAFYCLRTVLPGMRTRGGGRIVMISSVAARRPGPLSGAAYSASKAGMHALCAVVNAEEGSNGIRATLISPGEVDTEIMDKRPQPPSPEARSKMLTSEDIAEIILQLLNQPDRVWVEEIVVHPSTD